MSKPPTKAEKAYFEAILEDGCIVTVNGNMCRQPAEIHHVRKKCTGMSVRPYHSEVIPICPNHHRNGGHGVAVHAGVKTWERNFGSQQWLMKKARKRVK